MPGRSPPSPPDRPESTSSLNPPAPRAAAWLDDRCPIGWPRLVSNQRGIPPRRGRGFPFSSRLRVTPLRTLFIASRSLSRPLPPFPYRASWQTACSDVGRSISSQANWEAFHEETHRRGNGRRPRSGTGARVGADERRRHVRQRLVRQSFEPVHLSESIRSEEHTSELQSLRHLVCRLL